MEDAERHELFTENVNLAYWYVRRYFNYPEICDDLAQEALIGLWKATAGYTPEKGKFTTYAVICMRNEINMYLRSHNRWKHREVASLQDPVTDSGGKDVFLGDMIPDPNSSLEAVESEIHNFLKQLTPREKEVIGYKLRGVTQVSAAAQMGISQSYYSRLLRKIYNKFIEGGW